jgi:hypothetical protein
MRNYIFIIFIFLLVTNYSFSKEKETLSSVKENTTEDISNVTYKMLYENQVKANDAVLKTIFYALGGLGSAMLFVFASNWWFNEKKVSEIKNGISSQISNEINEIETKLNNEINTSITNLNSQFTDFTEKHRIETKEDNKNISENYQTQLKSFTENINIQNSTMKTSIDERFENIQKRIEINSDNTKNLIAKVKRENDIARKQLKLDVLNSEGSLWMIKGVYLNAYRRYLDEGILSIEIGWDFNLKYVFKNLFEVSSKISYITDAELEYSKKLIKLIKEDEYIEEKAKLEEILKNIKIENLN